MFLKSAVGEHRLQFMEFLLQKVCYENIEGDCIECGVYRGGSLYRLAKKLKELKSGKIIYGLDTFEGHPYSSDAKDTKHVEGFYGDNDFLKLRQLFNRKRLENVQLLKGEFTESFQFLENKKFSFIFLDCSLYRSYKDCINFLRPRMSKGAIMIFDDYNSHIETGTNKAIDEEFNKEELVILPVKQAYYIKQ
jgi:hypothetical protein